MFFEQHYYIYIPARMTHYKVDELLERVFAYSSLIGTELIWELGIELKLLIWVKGLQLWKLKEYKGIISALTLLPSVFSFFEYE